MSVCLDTRVDLSLPYKMNAINSSGNYSNPSIRQYSLSRCSIHPTAQQGITPYYVLIFCVICYVLCVMCYVVSMELPVLITII